jgi:hypothetical protein
MATKHMCYGNAVYRHPNNLQLCLDRCSTGYQTMGQKWLAASSQRAGAPISLRQWCTISAQAANTPKDGPQFGPDQQSRTRHQHIPDGGTRFLTEGRELVSFVEGELTNRVTNPVWRRCAHELVVATVPTKSSLCTSISY